jgi:hypothetical protein
MSALFYCFVLRINPLSDTYIMKKLLLGLLSAAALFPTPALSSDYTPYSISALGCMKLGECTDGVFKVSSVDHLETFDDLHLTDEQRAEADDLIQVLGNLKVEVFIAEPKYFPGGMLAVYYTDSNTIYLNANRTAVPTTILQSLRHEGWHAVQDCIAGSIDNTFMGVIFTDDEIPEKYIQIAQYRYGRFRNTAKAVPWEQGAIYAGDTPNLTLDTLRKCNEGPLWESIKPTPLTLKWLIKEGYMD